MNIPASLITAVTTPAFMGAIYDPEFGLDLVNFYWPLLSQDYRDMIAATDCRFDAMDYFMDAIDEVDLEALTAN